MPSPWRRKPGAALFHSEDSPMPNWLSVVCALSVCVAAAYLLYVILKPEDF